MLYYIVLYCYVNLSSKLIFAGCSIAKLVDESVVWPIGKDLFEKKQYDLLADLVDIHKSISNHSGQI